MLYTDEQGDYTASDARGRVESLLADVSPCLACGGTVAGTKCADVSDRFSSRRGQTAWTDKKSFLLVPLGGHCKNHSTSAGMSQVLIRTSFQPRIGKLTLQLPEGLTGSTVLSFKGGPGRAGRQAPKVALPAGQGDCSGELLQVEQPVAAQFNTASQSQQGR